MREAALGFAPPAVSQPPLVIGHRGAAGRAPENTLAGLRAAHSLGCRWVEFDVRLTLEGELVLLHDERLERTTTGFGNVRRLPLATIRRCDAGRRFGAAFAGEPVPSLTEAIAVLAELGLGANIELKSDRRSAAATGSAAAAIVARHWPSRLPTPLFSSFLPDALATARAHAPSIPRALLLRRPGGWRHRAAALGCAAVHVDHRALDRMRVAEITAHGCRVRAYTVNQPARAIELYGWGVVSVFSDVPDTILAALAAGGGRADPAVSQPAPARAAAAL